MSQIFYDCLMNELVDTESILKGLSDNELENIINKPMPKPPLTLDNVLNVTF